MPELVDLKITDYCDKKCKFCYQDSTTEGIHARLYNIDKILETLSESGVFEVAIGGGEPIFHPGIIEIFEKCKKYNIKPNITTADYDWFEYESFRNLISSFVGGIGVSITSISDLKRLKKILKGDDSGITFHYILGMQSIERFKSILNYVNTNFKYKTIVLLGYKSTGRGSNLQEVQYKQDWVKLAKKYEYVSISIDTKLATMYKHFLDKNNINDKTYYQSEGVYSKYIDAVNLTVAESSYSGQGKALCDDKSSWLSRHDVERLKNLLVDV